MATEPLKESGNIWSQGGFKSAGDFLARSGFSVKPFESTKKVEGLSENGRPINTPVIPPTYTPPATVVTPPVVPGNKPVVTSGAKPVVTPGTKPVAPVVDAGFSAKLDPNDPAAIGGALMSAPSQPPFNPKPIVTPPTSEIGKAFEDPSKLPDFFGSQFQGIKDTQQDVIDTRAVAPTSLSDLTTARVSEGFASAQQTVREVNNRVAQLNGTIANLESDIRKDLGPGVSESFIQAEVKRRLGDLEPVANRLGQEQAAAIANLQLVESAVAQRFGASRSDAAETVDRVSQALGFKTENMNGAMTLFTNLKQFELISDSQKDSKRDAARATVSLLLSSPRGLKGTTEEDLSELEVAGNLPTGVLLDIKSNLKDNETPMFQNVDDAGNLNMLLFDAATGVFRTQRYKNFAYVAPKSSGTGTGSTNSKLSLYASDPLKKKLTESYQVMAFAATKGLTAEQRKNLVVETVGGLGSAADPGNPADLEIVKNFKAGFPTDSELTAEKISATVQGFMDAE